MTDPEPLEAAKALRCTRVGALCPVRDAESEITVEQRALAEYDAALGIDLDLGTDGGFAS